ncbi:MAG: flagellar type III secretion system protein FliR [Armatimonadetes bacterium]|nr:flagellar type III secretion system protein FliR [Armatimonadota bacterium]
MNLFPVATQDFWTFLLVFTRLSGMMALAPIYGGRGVPAQARVGLAFVLSLVLMPLLRSYMPPVPRDTAVLVAYIFKEAAVGLLIGYIVQIFFVMVQMAGQFADIQMGFGLANVLDPMTQVQTSVLGQLQYMLMLLTFFAIRGDHILLKAVCESFRRLPTDRLTASPQNMDALYAVALQVLANAFLIGLKIAAPVVAAVLLVDTALAILSRTVPQMNVFLVGFPVKIGMGFVTLTLTMAFIIYLMSGMIGQIQSDILALFRAFRSP